MQIPVISQEIMFVPIYGPAGTDLTQFPADLALVAEGVEPGAADWHAATWLAPEPGDAPEASLVIGGTGVAYPAGEYIAWWRLTTATERPADVSGQVRIGTP